VPITQRAMYACGGANSTSGAKVGNYNGAEAPLSAGEFNIRIDEPRMTSSIRSTHDSLSRPRPIPEEVSLVDWPLRDEPIGSSLALALAAGAGWLTVWATGSAVMGLLIVGLLIVTLWRTWLPVRYQLGSGGVVQSVLGWQRRLAWLEIDRYQLQPDGVILYHAADGAPLAVVSGAYLHWGEQKDKVLAILKFYLPR
jgi:hypothetical protein